MAIVPDLSGNNQGVDRKLATPNREFAGVPIGVLTPQYSGEIVVDNTTGNWWFAATTTNTSWTPIFLGA